MKRSPRTARLLLAILLIVTVLSACAQPAAPTAAPQPAAPTAAPQPAAPAAQPTAAPAPTAVPPTEVPPTEVPPTVAKPIDIEHWVGASVSESSAPPDDWVAYKIVKDKLNINWKVVLLPSAAGDQNTKINAAGAANNLPDLFMVGREVLYKLVQQGLIAPVDSLLPMMPVRTKDHYGDPERNLLATWDGKLYGLPDPGTLPHIDGLVVRRDWLDKLGLQAPTTLDEFLEVAKAFTEQDPDGNGNADTYGFCAYIEGSGLLRAGFGTRFDWIFGAYGAAGTWNVSDAASFGLNVRDPNYMKAVEYIKKLVDAKVIDPDWPTLKKDEYRARWKQGKCGMMHENFAALSTKSNYSDFDKDFPDALWEVLPPPKGPEGKSANGVEVKDARIYAVSQKAMDAGKGPAIASLLEWMATDGYMLLGFGEEGVNYKLDSTGNITTEGVDPAKAYNNKEMQPLTQLRNMVYISAPIELAVRYPSFKTVSGRIQAPLDYRNGFLVQPYQESTAAAIINPPQNAADFVRFYSENLIKMALGQQPLDEQAWAEYVKGLDSLGAKELEAEAKETLTAAGFLK